MKRSTLFGRFRCWNFSFDTTIAVTMPFSFARLKTVGTLTFPRRGS